MVAEVVKHGMSGYRKGCHCEVCRRAKRDYMARYRSRRREREIAEALAGATPLELVDDAPLRDPVDAPAGLDMTAAPGPLERAFLDDLEHPDDRVAFRRHLIGMGRLNARVLDQVGTLDRLDLISPLELRQLEVLQRIALLGFRGLTDEGDEPTSGVADAAAKLLEEMAGGA